MHAKSTIGKGAAAPLAEDFLADFFAVFFEDFLVALFLVEPRLVAIVL